MKFEFIFIFKTPLNIAIEKGNNEIAKLLLSYDKIDVNLQNIQFCNFLLKFQSIQF